MVCILITFCLLPIFFYHCIEITAFCHMTNHSCDEGKVALLQNLQLYYTVPCNYFTEGDMLSTEHCTGDKKILSLHTVLYDEWCKVNCALPFLLYQ